VDYVLGLVRESSLLREVTSTPIGRTIHAHSVPTSTPKTSTKHGPQNLPRIRVPSALNSTVVTNRMLPIQHYFIGEKSVGCMYVTSTLSVVLLACSDLMTS
jgi:hypothetical protein